MANRRKYYVTIDTEACNTNTLDGTVTGKSAFVYDIGWIVADNHGNIIVQKTFLVKEVFFGMPDRMQTGYYKNKIPLYWKMIKEGEIKIENFFKIREIFLNDIKKFSAEAVIAFNALFDYDALNNTTRWLSRGNIMYFTPYNVKWECSLKMARSILREYKTYNEWCRINGYMTTHKTPHPQMKAEVIYKYVTHDFDFVEQHTALADVLIEYEIYLFCKRSHKKLIRGLWEKLPPKENKK